MLLSSQAVVPTGVGSPWLQPLMSPGCAIAAPASTAPTGNQKKCTTTATASLGEASQKEQAQTGDHSSLAHLDEKLAMLPPSSIPPTPITSIWSAGLLSVPNRGPSLPMADSMMMPLEVTSWICAGGQARGQSSFHRCWQHIALTFCNLVSRACARLTNSERK